MAFLGAITTTADIKGAFGVGKPMAAPPLTPTALVIADVQAIPEEHNRRHFHVGPLRECAPWRARKGIASAAGQATQRDTGTDLPPGGLPHHQNGRFRDFCRA